MRTRVLSIPSLFLVFLSGCSLLFEGVEEDGLGVDTTDSEACATLAPLRDDFSGPELSSRWQLSSSDGYDIFSQGDDSRPGANFSFTIPPNSVGVVNASLTSRYEHDLRNQSLTVQVGKIPAHISASVSVYPAPESGQKQPPNARIEHRKDTGNLYFIVENQERASIEYDSDRDVYWQIREAGAGDERRVYFETGPSLDELTSYSDSGYVLRDFNASHVLVDISAGTPTSGEVSFRSVNWNQEATTYCLASNFKDSFEGSVIAATWKLDEQDFCSFALDENSLGISTAEKWNNCRLQTTQALNLTHNQVELRFSPPLAINTGTLSLILLSSDQAYLQLRANSTGTMEAIMAIDGSESIPSGAVPIPSPITVMRIRHDPTNEQIYWEVEYANGTQSTLYNDKTDIELDGFNLRIRVGGSPSTVRIGGVNAD